MSIRNFEFKARVDSLKDLEEAIQVFRPVFIGIDFQRDTYFNVTQGRLKLREGNIENALIYYERTNTANPKSSTVLLYKNNPESNLMDILTAALEIKITVEKERRIWFIDNVKFHFDKVNGLGEFVEVEAIDKDGSIGLETLKDQCSFYAAYLNIPAANYIAGSYSDLLLGEPV